MGKGRAPCCDKSQVKKGPWSPAEDLRLITFIQKNGHDNWRSLPKQAGLSRCGKSCRLRWINYLRPDLKRGNFTAQEEDTIIKLHDALGNKWSKIASYFPGRTDNEIKNVWNTHLKKRALDCNRDTENYEYDQSKESSVTSSSTSSLSMASSHNLGEKRRAESELVMNDDDDEHDQRDGSLHIPKKPRESCRDVTDESNQSIKDMSRTSSFSSNYSSSVTNSGQVDHHDATTVRSEEDDQILDSFFEFSTDPYGFGTNTLGEVNKPENVPDGNNNNTDDISRIEIPLEADFDFWDLLDGVDAPIFQSDLIQCLEDGFLHINNNEEDVDNRKWFQYLENELGLESTEDQNQEKKSTKEPEPEPDQPLITAAEKPTVDPGMINFQPWPPSPPPPPTPVL